MHRIHTTQQAPTTKGRTITWAHGYDTVVKLLTLGMDRRIRERTVDLAGVQPGQVVLDVGCGTGSLTMAAQARVGEQGQVYGVDASPQMIEVARRKAERAGKHIDFRVEAVEKMSFPDGYFDAVLSSLMMHHLPGDLKLQALVEIRRVLKPGGRVLVVDFHRPTALAGRVSITLLFHGAMPSGIDEIASLFKQAGFSQVESGSFALAVLGFARGRLAA